MQETQVQFLGWEDPLEKGMASHSSILSWRILWTEEPGGLQAISNKESGHNWVANAFTFTFWVQPKIECNCLQQPIGEPDIYEKVTDLIVWW